MQQHVTRRVAVGSLLAAGCARAAGSEASRQATGIKIGEIGPDSATIWTRRTAAAVRKNDGLRRRGQGRQARVAAAGENVEAFEGACPGAAGFVRVSYEPASGKRGQQSTPWVELRAEDDWTHQFRLEGLRPSALYRIAVETRASRGGREDAPIEGRFTTAPREEERAAIRFALLSCQMYCRMDRLDGFSIYRAIERWAPDFLVSCGDNVYYDSEDPVVNRVAVARYHWQRMYSLPTLSDCLRSIPGYWQKDDHDLFSDDCWPGMEVAKQAGFTFEEGQRLFREQTPGPPAGAPPYRVFHWGRDLDVILPESRDYRTPNPEPDGSSKTIWGERQKKWLLDTLSNSRARFKVVVNPNPVVGPDHKRKNDNHANPAFASEGMAFRRWLKANTDGSVILMNGDRHWQYHSVDPESGIHEFGCGPASDAHAVAPSEGEDPDYHRFLRIKGGFLAITLTPNETRYPLAVEHRDVKGDVVHRQLFPV